MENPFREDEEGSYSDFRNKEIRAGKGDPILDPDKGLKRMEKRYSHYWPIKEPIDIDEDWYGIGEEPGGDLDNDDYNDD